MFFIKLPLLINISFKNKKPLLISASFVLLTIFMLSIRPVLAQTKILKTAATETLIIAKSNDPKETLVAEILKLALSKNKSATQYKFQQLTERQTEGRSIEMLKEGSMSVFWAGTQIQYEKNLLPVRIPVLKGMLGHRIFIIRNGDQTRFDNVHSLDELRRIPLGQGRFWGDTVVLKHAALNVIAPVKYENLFHMLEGSRFDFFPRAIHEPWSEVSARPDLNLTIEKRLLLIYPFAMYYFVAPENETLAQDIEFGFRRAIDDGSFDSLFFSHPMIKDALQFSRLQDRLIFRLDNPNMHPDTPLEDASLWLDISELEKNKNWTNSINSGDTENAR